MRREYILFILTTITVIFLYNFVDREVAIYFYSMPNGEIKDFFHFITRFGRSEWYLVPSILLFWYFRKVKNRESAKIALYIFTTNVVAGVGVLLLKVIFGRARPKLFLQDNIYGFQWFEVSHKLTSFPSGHTITAISSALALSLLFPRFKYLFIPFGLLVALSRVVGVNHYVSDVVFASFLGSIVATLLYRYFFKKKI